MGEGPHGRELGASEREQLSGGRRSQDERQCNEGNEDSQPLSCDGLCPPLDGWSRERRYNTRHRGASTAKEPT